MLSTSFQVITFFYTVALGVFVSGLLLKKNFKGEVIKKFSTSMLTMAVAFAIWGIGLILGAQGALLATIVSIGLLVFSIAQIINIYLVAYDEKTTYKYTYLSYGIGLLILIFVLRMFLPSDAFIAENGMIFFNPNETVNFFEILFISSALIPANLVVWREMRKQHETSADIFAGSVFAALLGGIMLISTSKVILLTWVGWAMSFATVAMIASASGFFKRRK
jgi:hypothetical protein